MVLTGNTENAIDKSCNTFGSFKENVNSKETITKKMRSMKRRVGEFNTKIAYQR